jgi:hypothetical protein
MKPTRMSEAEQIQCQLARLGLRSAGQDESGWFVTVEIYTFPGRATRKVWATSPSSSAGRVYRRPSGKGLPAQAALWRR